MHCGVNDNIPDLTCKLVYICLFHTHMVYCYIMTNIIMNAHNNNNRYNINIEVIS